MVFSKAKGKSQAIQNIKSRRAFDNSGTQTSDEIAAGTLNSIFKQAQLKNK